MIAFHFERVRAADPKFIAQARNIRVLHLFTHRGEKLPDSYFADLISNEGRNGAAAIGVNRGKFARVLVSAVRFE